MTDQNPVPTTRMPIPNEPFGDESSHAGETSPVASDSTAQAYDPDRAATSPPAEQVTVPPVAPVAPVAPMPERTRLENRDAGRTASVLFGMVMLGLGLWFFAEHTLGFDLPRISWSQLWPVALIAIGLWVVLGSMRRGSR